MTFLNKIGKSLRGKYYSFEGRVIKNYPIMDIKKDKQKLFIQLTNKTIQLNQDLANAKTPHEKKLLKKQIESTDKKNNQMVYELYELNDEEIDIIEKSLDS